MDAHTDFHLTRGDTSQNSLAEGFTVDHEHDPGNTTVNEDLVPDNHNSSASDVHLILVTDGGDIEPHKGQSPIHPFKSDQEPSDIQTAGNRIDHDRSCTHPQSNSDPVILTTISNEVPPSECAVVPAGGSTSLTNVNDLEACTIAYPQEPPLLRAGTVSSAIAPREEGESDPVDRSNCIQMPHTELDHVHSAGLAGLTDEEETREAFDYPCADLSSSLPPSSSPPQLFASSPFASSQSSASGIEPSKMVLVVEVEGCASSQDCPHDDHVLSVAQDESCLESKNLHSHDITDIAASPETDGCCPQMDPTSCIEGGPGPPRKRTTYQNDLDESYGPESIKRPKLDSGLYLPPTPKRATLASQNRQFKKLASPFRPPSKLPIVTDGLPQTRSNKGAEPTTSATPETGHDQIDIKGSTVRPFPLQHKASNTSRSVAQFKSPLVNRVLPAESRTIRLTPAVQALERKLQLLKRAIKVKEDKEEDVLTRLATKWIEAGREVAYDVWDATKDAGDFERKATFIRRSYGWESTNSENTPWGWDTKPEDAGEESRDPDPSVAPCGAGQLAPEAEADDDVGCNTLGTMLRQLGIAPELFGWDDEKETFSD